MPIRLLGAAILGLLLTPVPASAQEGCTGGGRYHLRPSPAVLIAPTPGPSDLDAGQVDAGVLSVRIIPRGNASKDWELCLRSVAPTMGPAGKPTTDVEYWSPDGGAWLSASMVNQVIARGRGRSDIEIRFRIRVSWTDEPGTYSCVLALSLAAT